MLPADLHDRSLRDCAEIEAEMSRMRRRYGDTSSIDLRRFRWLCQLDVLLTATAAVAAAWQRCDDGLIGREGRDED